MKKVESQIVDVSQIIRHMPDVSAADQVAVVDAAIQAAELGLASLASVADKAPLLAPGAKRSDTREADTREEAEIKQSAKVGKTFAERSAQCLS